MGAKRERERVRDCDESARRSARRVFGALLLLFPTRYRTRFGADAHLTFVSAYERARRRGTGAVALFWWRTVTDVVGAATRERWSGLAERRRDRARQLEYDTRLRGLTVTTLIQDTRFAFRVLRRNPVHTVTVVVTLALGIGANTAIFGLIDGVLLTPLPFTEPDELVVVWESHRADGVAASPTSSSTFLDWRERQRSFQDLTAWRWSRFTLEDDQGSLAVDGVVTFPNLLSVLGTSPLLGRAFTMDDAQPRQAPRVIMLSHALWRDRYGADPNIIGRSAQVNQYAVTIIGVLRPDIAAPDPDAQVLVPVQFAHTSRWMRYSRDYEVYGRLRPGVSDAEADADMRRVARDLRTGEYSDIYDGWDTRVVPLRDYVVAGADRPLLLALGVAVVVLLIGCVNVANLLLARTSSRAREMAVRSALGAGRQRLVRQVLTESCLLASAGGAAGIGLGAILHHTVLILQPDIIPRAEELGLDWTAFAFGFGVSLVTGLLFGAAPALFGSRVNLTSSLTLAGSRSGTGGATARFFKSALLVGQLSATVVLVTGAGLLIRTMGALYRVDPGFESDGVVAARVFMDVRRFDSQAKIRDYVALVESELAGLPGVSAVGATSALPMDPLSESYDLPYRFEGQGDLAIDELPEADFWVVTPGYFEALGIQSVTGRGFTNGDRANRPFVTVINETMARLVWPGRSPIGARFETPSIDWTWFEVVGVVRDTRYDGLTSEPRPSIYAAHAQVPREAMTFVARTDGRASALVEPMRRAFGSVDPSQPAHRVVPMSELVADSVRGERFSMLLLTVFAGIALTLSAAGVYGVYAFWVRQRTHEIGVRMALGAERHRIAWHMLREGAALTAIALAFGLGVAFVSTDLLLSGLFGVAPHDPFTFIGAAAVLAATALAACGIPAYTAARLDPVAVLRME